MILEAHTEPRVLLNLILNEQRLCRPLTLVEKARFVAICGRHLTPDDIVSDYLQPLQLRRQKNTLDDLTALLLLDSEIIDGIDQGFLQEKMVAELLALRTTADRIALVRLFHQLHLGDNQQKKLFSALRDLSRRRQVTLATYLQLPEIAAILTHPHLNGPQKVQHLGRFLQQQLTPELVTAEQNFHCHLNELQLPSRCSLQHSQAFETDAVDLTITFQDISACAALLPAIKNLLADNQQDPA